MLTLPVEVSASWKAAHGGDLHASGQLAMKGDKWMHRFVYEALPGRIVFGVGTSRSELSVEIERLRVARILLLTSARGRELAEQLAVPLGDRVVGVFTDVRLHVPAEIAEAARSAARAVGADCLLPIGGGSTTGTAKVIALAMPLPIVAVPTTYAGSEVTPIWGLTAGQRKQTGRAVEVLPKVVIYDPELTYSLPSNVTGPSAMNALAHCVEALYAPGANPVTSLLAEDGIRRIAHGLPTALAQPDHLDARSELLYGAYLAGAVLAAAGAGLHHKICHVLGGAYNLPHAELHTVILPYVAAFNQPALSDVMGRIARALNSVSAAAGLYDLARHSGAPAGLKDLGVRRENLDEATGLVLAAAPQDNPRPIDRAGVRQILESAYTGLRPEVIC